MKKLLQPTLITALLFGLAVSGPARAVTTETWGAGTGSTQGVSGGATLTLSALFLNNMNLTGWKLAPAGDSVMAISTSTSSTGLVRYTAASVTAPITSLTGEVNELPTTKRLRRYGGGF